MRGCCNIEMYKLHLDEIVYRGQYDGVFDALVRDNAFFYTC